MKTSTVRRIKVAHSNYLADGERHPANLLSEAAKMLVECALANSDDEAEPIALAAIARLVAYIEAES